MSKKLLSIILLTGIVLSACGGQAAQATETSTITPEVATEPPATNTAAEATTPEVDETEIAATFTPTPSATPTQFVPENAADCVNQASFVSDVTLPDNSNVPAGAAFTKTWRVQNTGTCIWWSGYTLQHYSENAMSAPASIPLPVTNPGETADVSVDLVAPSVPGTYRGNFVIKNPSDLIMQVDEDSRLWLIINVSSAPTGTTTPTAGAGTGGGGSTTSGTPSSASAGEGYANVTCAFTTDAPRIGRVATAINAYRAENSRSAYNVNAQLSEAAQAHANDMACNQLFVHNGSDGSTPQSRVEISGYGASTVTENVYGSYPPLTPEEAVTWWKNDKTDPNHNLNLISATYSEIGIGYAFFDNFGYYVIVFAAP